jgi:hypothetical protein
MWSRARPRNRRSGSSTPAAGCHSRTPGCCATSRARSSGPSPLARCNRSRSVTSAQASRPVRTAACRPGVTSGPGSVSVNGNFGDGDPGHDLHPVRTSCRSAVPGRAALRADGSIVPGCGLQVLHPGRSSAGPVEDGDGAYQEPCPVGHPVGEAIGKKGCRGAQCQCCACQQLRRCGHDASLERSADKALRWWREGASGGVFTRPRARCRVGGPRGLRR